jgi:hypothetical protein
MATSRKQAARSPRAAKASTTRRSSSSGSSSPPSYTAEVLASGAFGRPELVVVAHAGAGLRARHDGVTSTTGAAHRTLSSIMSRSNVTLRPMFGAEDRVQREASIISANATSAIPDLSVFYTVDAPVNQLQDLCAELYAVDEIDGAYIKPGGEPPVMDMPSIPPSDAPPVTPDLTGSQGYLDPAPGGIDARYAWTWPGGSGAGVSIIDCEWGWRFDHEDLLAVQGGVVVGTAGSDTHHGTAVIGEMSGDRNSFGITGICPDAMISAAAFSGPTATTIRNAANRLQAGDLILLEIHRAGPRNNFAARQDQHGYIAIEWWPDDFAAIAFAIGRGIIVVEAAGNGQQDLDDAIYSVRPAGFPTTWTNPFNRANRDSGAIVVGAGAPPPNTHGRSHGADRSRLDFSNYGALIDAQGWGREVTTAGYGHLQDGDATVQYTDRFSGTSSASPIVTGALACLQGGLRAAGRPVLTPANARTWLRASGSPQQDEPGRPATQRIGNRPNLRQLFQSHVKGSIVIDKAVIKDAKSDIKDLKEGIKDRKELKEIKEKDRKEKFETKEIKDKDRKELKEKDLKEKDRKEFKEFKEKDRKEFKEIRENEKLIENWDRIGGVRGGGIGGGFGPGVGGADPTGLEDRLAGLEEAVSALTHFISAELRPDLSVGALNREADLWGDADQSKSVKDGKDKEHLAEG